MIAYLGFWVMCLVSLFGRPHLGLYYLMPFLPYRTLRDHFLDYPLGGNVVTILVIAILAGAFLKGKRLPKSKLYLIWFVFGAYLYLSMWLGTALGNGPPPLWTSDINFATWKDYMLIPLIFVAAGMVVEDRKAVRTVILITAVSLFFIDRSFLLETLSRSWGSFDENKRNSGPLGYGSNQTAAFLAQFAMFFWGLAQFLKRKKAKLLSYGLVAITLFATMYTFSRGSYLAVILSTLVLGILKDRKLLLLGAVFLVTWQAIVPAAVTQRVNMTEDANGQLESSAEERVKLWEDSKTAIASDPIFGIGYATYQLTEARGWTSRHAQLVCEGDGGDGHCRHAFGFVDASADGCPAVPAVPEGGGSAVSRTGAGISGRGLFVHCCELFWRPVDLSRD